MGIKANYLKIGVFVVFTCALLMAGVVFWGAKVFNQKEYLVETYIDQSVKGLTVGSPVYSRGVQIGEVADITFVSAVYDLPEGSEDWRKYGGYVYILMSLTYDRLLAKADPKESVEMYVERGFRLRISSNPLTGISFLQGDLLDPNEYPSLPFSWEPKYSYIPWTPSAISEFLTGLEKTMKRIEDLDIEGLFGNAKKLLADMDQAVLDLQVAALRQQAGTLVTDADTMIVNATSMLRRTKTAKAPTTVEDILNHMNQTVEDIDQAVANADISGISDDGKKLLVELRESNRKLQSILRSTEASKPPAAIDQVLADVDTAVRRLNLLMKQYGPGIQQSVGNIAATSGNLKEASERIKRQPSTLLFSEPPTHSEIVE